MPIEQNVRRAIADEVSSLKGDDWEAAWDAIQRRLDRKRRPRPLARAVAVVSAAAVTAGLVFLLVRAFGMNGEAPASDGPTPERSTASSIPPLIPHVSARVVDRFEVGPHGATTSLLATDEGVWATYYSGGRDVLVHIDARTGRVTEVRIEGVPSWVWGGGGMALGFGSVWVVGWAGEYGESSMHAIIQRVDEVTRDMVVIPLPGRRAIDVAVDTDSVWVLVSTASQRTHRVVRLDPLTGAVTDQIAFDADWVRSILPISDTVWVSTREVHGNSVGGGSVIQLDPRTGTVIHSVRFGGTFTEPVRTDAIWWVRGSSYWPQGTSSHDIVRIDPVTGEENGAWPVGPVGYEIAPAPDGAVWFLGVEGGNPAVMRFNPSTGRVDETVEIERTLLALSVSDSSVWVLDHDGGITQIELEPTGVP